MLFRFLAGWLAGWRLVERYHKRLQSMGVPGTRMYVMMVGPMSSLLLVIEKRKKIGHHKQHNNKTTTSVDIQWFVLRIIYCTINNANSLPLPISFRQV